MDINIKEILSDEYKINQFLKENRRLIYDVLKKVRPSILGTYEEEDYFQEGMIGLYKAMKKFDETRDCQFGTLAYIYIKNQILHKVKCEHNKLKQSNNNITSLNETAYSSDSDEIELIETLTSKDNIENKVLTKFDYNNIINAINKKYSKNNHAQIFKYLLAGYSQTDIAKIFNLSRQNISQKIKQIQKRVLKLEII